MAFTGQTVQEMLGSGWSAALHPDDAAAAAAGWNQAVAQQVPFHNEHRIRRYDGQWRWMSAHAVPIVNTSGTIEEWFGMCLDIHDRRAAQQALQQRHEQLELLARCSQLLLMHGQPEHAPVATVFSEVARSIGADTYVHHEALDAHELQLCNWDGLTDEQQALTRKVRAGEMLCGRVALQRQPLIVEDMAHVQVPGTETARAAGYTAYAGFALLAGPRLLGTVGFLSRQKTHFAAGEVHILQTVCDQVAAVLERSRLQDELRHSAARFRAIADYTYDWESWIGTDGQLKWVNPAVERFTGVSVQTCMAMQHYPLPLLEPQDRPRMREQMARALAGESGNDQRFCIRRPDGAQVWGAMSWQLIVADDGTALGVRTSMRDISRRHQAERALEKERQRLSSIIFAANVGTWEWNVQTGQTRFNERWADILGYSLEELAPVSIEIWLRLTHPDDLKKSERQLQRHFSGELDHYECEARMQHKNGHWVWVLDRGRVLSCTADGKPLWMQGTHTDISLRKQADTTLRMAGETFRQLVEESPFGIYAVDADFRLAMVSAGAQKVFEGVQPLLGRPFDEVLRVLWGEPFVSQALAHFRHTLETGEPHWAPDTVEWRQDLNQTAAYDWRLSRVVLPDGRPGVVCHFYDLSERQQYEESLRVARNRLETALNASQIVLFHQDRDLRYTWIHNPALGLSAPTVLGQRDVDLTVHAEDGVWLEAIKRSVLESGQARREEVCITRETGTHYFDLFVQPDRDTKGCISGVNGAAVDITARKLIEARLQRADRQKDEFLAMLAHELRNPLAPIRHASLTLSRTVTNDPRAQRPLAVIDRQTRQLTRLVEDLLDVARVTQGRVELKLELLEIGDILEQAIETVQPLLETKQHRLRVDRPQEKLYVHGDRTRLVQVLSNLLHNAANYTEPTGEIQLTVRADSVQLDIMVRDTGVGIPPDLLPRVFDLFVQNDRALDRPQGGLGIGLSVAKELVRLHGGSVQAHSEGIGHGAAFTVRLPRAAAPRRPAASTPPPAPVAVRRILVVDDNVDAADSLAQLLAMDGHRVETVYSGMAALDAVSAREPDVVLLDIGMPGMDGFEVARRLRARTSPQAKHLRLVAVTGYGQEADRAQCDAAGFDAHLLKPADPAALARVLMPNASAEGLRAMP